MSIRLPVSMFSSWLLLCVCQCRLRHCFFHAVMLERSFVWSYIIITISDELLNSLYETEWKYSLAAADDLVRFWRSKVKVTAGLSMQWRRHSRPCLDIKVHLLSPHDFMVWYCSSSELAPSRKKKKTKNLFPSSVSTLLSTRTSVSGFFSVIFHHLLWKN